MRQNQRIPRPWARMAAWGALLGGLFAAVLPAAATPMITVDSAPTAVTVLPEGAWVTRQMTLSLPATGTASVAITQLPGSLDRASVQIASDQADLTAPIQWRQAPIEQSPAWIALHTQQVALDQREAKASDALLAAQLRLQVLQAEVSVPERSSARSHLVLPTVLTDPAAKAAFDRLLTTLIESQRTAKNELAEIAQARAALQTQFDDLKNQPPRQVAELKLARRQAGSEPVNLTLRYRVADAAWRPVYRADLMLPPASDKSSVVDTARIHWRMTAEVSQQTGEDWSAVPLTLALQDTRRYVPVPHFSRWTIGFAPPLPAPRQPLMSEAVKAMVAPASAPMMELANDSGFQAEFHSQQPVTVLSGSAQSTGSITIPLLQQTVDAVPALWVAPPTLTQAVLTARFTPELTEALPPGTWQLFLAGTQVAEIQRPALQPKQEIRLSFGEDPKVRVNYTAAPNQREENGLIGKSTQMQRSFTVSLTSAHTRAVPVTVLMQMPVPVDAELSVEPLLDLTPPTSKQFEQIDGLWAWSNQLKPGQKISIQFGYRVRWPSDKTVYGLR
ncbi:DUF4139 domain-containing protein [Halothiobacillus sp. DCM-1]|uniref:DUF4139 domain-containing protein n=1 Tax=Halothiobacillus sp. DCM-1 TaxID=3112558 RepID=UPI0032513AFB